ncbi:hypothetical protein [Flagellimonas sp. 2504JD4-2]
MISLIFLTVIVVVVKLKFLHYNLLFPIVLIITIAFILKKCILSKDYKFFFIGLLVLNFLCLVVPDKMVYKLRKNHRYFWSEKPLNLSHFKIVVNTETDTTAMVHPTLIGEISKVYNYPPAILFTSDQIGISWIDTTSFDDSPEGKKALQELFEHEKRHLDINEIYTRKAQDSIDQMLFSSYMEKYRVIDYFFEISDSIQDVFDVETNHGLDEEQSEKWNAFVKEELHYK